MCINNSKIDIEKSRKLTNKKDSLVDYPMRPLNQIVKKKRGIQQ